MRLRLSIVAAVCLLLPLVAGPAASAHLKPHALFSDHMVLQLGRTVPIWGQADDGEKITVKFCGQNVSTTCKDGKWMVRLKPLKAGGPHTLTISGHQTVEIKDVLVGEVWVCSGQSNMQWSVKASANPEQTIANSANPKLRLFTVPRRKEAAPVSDIPSQWVECGPETVPGFTAVGYFFGRDLQKALKIPVGLIHTSWGGSPAEVWMDERSLTDYPDGKAVRDQWSTAKAKYEVALKKHNAAKAKAKAEGKEFKKKGPRQPWVPTELYNGMIHPLLPYGIAGAIWYQGESNATRAHQYRTLFPAMIQCWREVWAQGDFPFLLVQLAPFQKIRPEPYDCWWGELREAQLLSTWMLPKVGMAVITDVGDENDIHPKWKAPVGARLALAARAIQYGEKIVYSGPEYESVTIDEGKAVLSFKHVGRGLVARDGALKGFEIAGKDRKFYNAKASIKGDKVIVRCPKVPEPVAVRYGWAQYPVVNLWNKDGLPATPFRTDNFPMITVQK